MPGDKRYRAFISYSHEDRRIADRLQRDLEAFRVPRRLVGKDSEFGPVPLRVTPIFRDRTGLSVAESLSEAVETALLESQALIVICSPSAARSKWVDEEVRGFRRVNPQGRIFAAVVDGQPLASLSGQRPDRECFPPALLDGREPGDMSEPLAADFRPDGDGRRMGVVKLVAGLTGLRPDELVRRDLQRRQRRVMAITLASTIMSLTMVALTLFALSAQSEAERRKAEAEDLIEFMLSDLKESLEPVGRLSVLDAVGDKVLEYYANQSERGMSANEYRRQAEALILIGDISLDLGDLDKAMSRFEDAYAISERALADDPNNPQRIFDHAQSTYWVGEAAMEERDYDRTVHHFTEYRDLALRLVEIEPENVEYQMEMGYSHTNMGAVHRIRWDIPAALDAYQQALNVKLALADRRENYSDAWWDVSNAYSWIASTITYLEDPVEARTRFLEVKRLHIGVFEDQLAEYLVDDWRLRSFAIGHESMMAEYMAIGRSAGDGELTAAINILEGLSVEVDALAVRDPDNSEWQEAVFVQRYRLSKLYLQDGRMDDAEAAYTDAMRILSNPNLNLTAQIFENSLSRMSVLEAEIHLARGDYVAAERVVSDLLSTIDSELDQEGVSSAPVNFYIQAELLRADIAEARGEREHAQNIRRALLLRIAPLRYRLYLEQRTEIHRIEAEMAPEAVSIH